MGNPTNIQLQKDVTTLRASLPSGSVASSTNYIAISQVFNITNQVTSGHLLAFTVVALFATVAIVASLVTGIEISAYREIGIVKAVHAAHAIAIPAGTGLDRALFVILDPRRRWQ